MRLAPEGPYETVSPRGGHDCVGEVAGKSAGVCEYIYTTVADSEDVPFPIEHMPWSSPDAWMHHAAALSAVCTYSSQYSSSR